ncbi:EF-hand domain-containing protein [Sulfurimonas sp. HSL-1716]|uniref:EF-hand domain-containing protein n=1 Tax=Hydrocurvibacter sulfurireducens TaxID=3131937 RepID=UPI0031F72467
MTVNSSMQANYANILNTQNQNKIDTSSAAANFNTMMQQLSNQLISSLDTNKDGSIDKTEFSAAAKQLSQDSASLDSVFNSVDLNADGKIDATELMNALEKTAQNRQHKHAHLRDKANGTASESNELSMQQNSATQTAQNASSQNDNGLQSILMKNILSAYSVSHSQKSGGSLSLSV